MNFPVHLERVDLQHEVVDLFVPNMEAIKKAYKAGEIAFPYWAKLWPAGKALGQFLQRHPHFIAGKTVLELGAGLGLPSLVAARKASAVLCTDVVPEAVDVAWLSAQHHGLRNFHSSVMDWGHLPDGLTADVVLLSDVNYEAAAFAQLRQRIQFFLQKKMTVLLSTPQRLVAKEFVAPLLSSCTQQEEVAVKEAGETVMITVLVLEANPAR